MQTFLPHPNFYDSACALDTRRLGKQIVEVVQILAALRQGPRRPDGKPTPWYGHPAVQAWRGFEGALATYGYDCCTVWLERGRKTRSEEGPLVLQGAYAIPPPARPEWTTDPLIHASHRGLLYRKAPNLYPQWGEYATMPRLYPVVRDGVYVGTVREVGGHWRAVDRDGAMLAADKTPSGAARKAWPTTPEAP